MFFRLPPASSLLRPGLSLSAFAWTSPHVSRGHAQVNEGNNVPHYGLRKTGVVGILIRARLDGKVTSLRQELDRLRLDAGFWITEDLYRQALEAVGESME
jgi:hypothetical protein